VRSKSVTFFKQLYEIKPRKRSLSGDLFQVYLLPEMLVDEELGLNDPAVEICFWIMIRHIPKVVISLRPPELLRRWAKQPQMKLFRSFTQIINYKTLIVTTLSVVSTYLCYKYQLIAKFPDMLVGVAIVFPVVFSIGSAYNRRETALQKLSDFKGHAVAIYFATKDWHGDNSAGLHTRVRSHIHEMLLLMRNMFKSKGKEDWHNYEKQMYVHFSQMSALTMELRGTGVQSGEISRVSQYVSKMIIAFDNMKIIHAYRTPVTLRAYSKVFLYIFPIIYGPYFASTVGDYSPSLEYVMPVLYSFILVSLDNIQDHLENPFDEVGEDDIIIEADDTTQMLA
jgi:hypothetical protein